MVSAQHSPNRWGAVLDELAADVRRVADRLRGLSAAQLAAPPRPSTQRWPEYGSRAQAGRAAATELALVACSLEAAAGSPREAPDLPKVSDFAVGDQVAVTGHDLVAAMARTAPATEVWLGSSQQSTAAEAVSRAARCLADVRRRI